MAGAIIKSLLKESIKNMPEQSIKKDSVVPALLKKGVKQEELEYSGFMEGLKDVPGLKVNKEELTKLESQRKDKFYTTEVGYHYKHVSLPGGQTNPTYREKVLSFKQADQAEASRYTSSHYPDEDNYLAHTRIYDEDMDGVPTRVLQEMQSDLHQTGRRTGYAAPGENPSQLTEEQKANVSMFLERYRAANEIFDEADEITEELEDQLALATDDLHDYMSQIDPTYAEEAGIEDAAERMAAGDWTRYGPEGETLGVPQSPYEKTWLSKTIERELVDALNEGRSQLAIPIKGAGIENLHRGAGVQKWYETQVLNTAKKVAKRAGAEFEVTGTKFARTEWAVALGEEEKMAATKDFFDRAIKLQIEHGNAAEDMIFHHEALVNLTVQERKHIVRMLSKKAYDEDLVMSGVGKIKKARELPAEDTQYAVIRPKGYSMSVEYGGGELAKLKQMYGEFRAKRKEAGQADKTSDKLRLLDESNVLDRKLMEEEDRILEKYEGDHAMRNAIKQIRLDGGPESLSKSEFVPDKPVTMSLYTTPTAGAFAAYTAYKTGYTTEQVNAQLAEKGFDDEEIAEINATAEKIAQAEAAGYSKEEIQGFLKGKEIEPVVTQNQPKPVEPLIAEPTGPVDTSYNQIADESVELEPKDLVRNLEIYLPTAVSTTGTLIPAFFGSEAATQRLQIADQAAKTRIVKLAKDKFGIDLVRQAHPGTGEQGWFIQTENGLVDATPDALTEWMSIGAEVALGMTSAIVGGKAAAAVTPPVLPVVGPLAKPLGFAVGAFTGGLLSDLAFQEVNYLHSAMKLQEEMESATMKHLGMSAVENALIGEVIGYSAVKLAGATWKGLKRTKDFIFDGNSKGAYKALKDTTFLDDSQLDELVGQLERIMGKELPGNKEQKAIQAYTLTAPGGQTLAQATAGLDAQATKAIAHSVDKRAKDLISLSEELMDDKVPQRFIKDLNNYTNDVKNFYNSVKMRATQSPRGNNFDWDYDELAIEPVLERLQSKITDPVTSEKFLMQAQRIRDLSESRSFGDLIELRQITNDFLYNKRITKADDKSMLRGIIARIDDAIVDGAPQVVDQPEAWLKDWATARMKYTDMKNVEQKAIYKLIFDKKGNVKPVQPETVVKALGKYATALDGSFEEVMSKLPIKARSDYEQAVVDSYVKKFTLTAQDGSQAINFPRLADDLNQINFTAPNARNLKKVVNDLAEVFKNDAALSGISSSYDKITINQGLSSDLAAKAKYSLMAKIWDEIQTTTALGKRGREYSLIKNATTLLEQPLNAKSAKELLEQYPTDTALAKQVRELQQQAAKSRAAGLDLTSPRVYVDAGGKLTKDKTQKAIPMHRIATEQQVKDIADANALTVDSKSLTKILKKHGYVAKMHGTDRIKELK